MISGVTKKAVIELFQTFNPDPYGLKAFTSFTAVKPIGIQWWGNLDEIEFLQRLYELEDMPSNDDRYTNALGDIHQHRYNNDDWESNYIFTDERFELQSSEKKLLHFLAETLHPEVRTDRDEVNQIRSSLNDLLRPDLYELRQVDVISGKPVYGAVAIQPRKITSLMLRDAIAYAIWLKGPSAPNLPAYCDSLKMPNPESKLDPMSSKKIYVKERLKSLERPELIKIARDVIDDCPEDSLIDLINEIDTQPRSAHKGQPKNLLFAANGYKPEIVLADSIDNDIAVTKNENFCLIYADYIDPNQGLSWTELASWWMSNHALADIKMANRELYKRLAESCNTAELVVLSAYGSTLKEHEFRLPALLPQVYLHFDPLTEKQRGTVSPLTRQRMDFLMLLPGRQRIIIELDGSEHYSDKTGRADPKKYAEMMREDRRVRLAGYEVYRFGGQDFVDKNSAKIMLKMFFEGLLQKYGIK